MGGIVGSSEMSDKFLVVSNELIAQLQRTFFVATRAPPSELVTQLALHSMPLEAAAKFAGISQ
jgi:hypothetical protein